MDRCPKCDAILEPDSFSCGNCQYALEQRASGDRRQKTKRPVEDDAAVVDQSLGPSCPDHHLPIAGTCPRCNRKVCMRCMPDMNTSSNPRCDRCKGRGRSAAPQRGAALAEDDGPTAVSPTVIEEEGEQTGGSLASIRRENARASRQADEDADEDQGEGLPLGGFLYFVGVLIAIDAVVMVVATPVMLGLTQMLGNTVRTSPLNATAKQDLQEGLTFLKALWVLDAGLLCALCWAYWTRRVLAVWIILCHLALNVVSAILGDGGLPSVVGNVLWSAVWFIYFLTDARVKRTFVKT
jgi:hypothetical protein